MNGFSQRADGQDEVDAPMTVRRARRKLTAK